MIVPEWARSKHLDVIVGSVMYLIAAVSGDPLFADLLLARHKELWGHENPDHPENYCKNRILPPNASDVEWYCCPIWQRKLSNKLNAKAFATRNGVRVSKTLWMGADPSTIPFKELPASYVVKCSTGWNSNQVLPIRNGINLFTGEFMSKTEIAGYFQKIICTAPYYDGTIFVEELIQSVDGESLPLDYKCFCFNGEVKFIMVVDRFNKTVTWYTPEWNLVADQMILSWKLGKPQLPPSFLPEIISCAEILSSAYCYPFVRIDLYCDHHGVLFGEFTHTPQATKSRILYTPFANRTMGRYWAQVKS